MCIRDRLIGERRHQQLIDDVELLGAGREFDLEEDVYKRQDARIEDLTVCGSAAGEARASYAAGLVSYAKGCEIEDINVYVDVTAAGTHAGGVAAYICDGTAMQGCFSYGSVSGKSGVCLLYTSRCV